MEHAKLLRYILSNCTLTDATVCPTYRNPFSLLAKGASCQTWGLLLVESENREGLVAQLVITYHARRYGVLQASIDQALPEIRSRAPAPPKNFVLEAIRVKDFMTAHPDETCQSAAPKLNLHRKRISKFLAIANNLPANLITKLANCNDPKTLRQMTLNRLLDLSCHT